MLLNKDPFIEIKTGDILEKIKEIPDSSVDLIVTDPPYNLNKNYGNNHDSLEFSEYLDFSRKWLKEADRVLKPDGTVYIFMGMRLISYIKMNRIVNDVLQCLVATLIVYIIGTLFMYFYLNSKSTYTLGVILGFSIVPYLPFDAAKIVIAVLAAIPLRKVIKEK